MFLVGRIIGRTSDVPAQAALVKYTVTSVEGQNRPTLRDVLPLKRPVYPNDANDPNAFPDIVPAEVGKLCVLIRLSGSLALWETPEAEDWGPCQ